MQHTTWMGRNHKAITYASHYFSQRKEPLVAWVVGLGGEQGAGTEHLEVALSLKKGGVRNYLVHAVEPDPENLSAARRILEDEKGVPVVLRIRKTHSKAYALKDLEAQRAYLHELTGVEPVSGVPFRFRVPMDVVRRFHWHGPGEKADILRSVPPEAPDLVTCFNVAQHYRPDDQRRMAAALAESLKPGGLLLTNQRADLNSEFIQELERRLSAGVLLEEIPLLRHQSEKLMAFHHGRTTSAGGVILLR